MKQTDISSHSGSISVASLEPPLKRKDTSLWRSIEKRLLTGDPWYIPRPVVGESGEETEFFLLYDGDTAVGRAAASVNREWIESHGENLGFISDFIIDPEHSQHAGLLIDSCLDALRGRGVGGAIVRYHGFPALAAQELDDIPPYGLPGNPSWYIEIFERSGFLRHKEWANLRITLPRKVPKEEVEESRKCIEKLDVKAGPLRLRSRSQVDQYHDLAELLLESHFGYIPSRFIERDDPRTRHVAFALLCWLLKFKAYLLEDASGVVGCISFAPNFNVARRHLMRVSTVGGLFLALPRSLISLRRAKRAQITVGGFAPEMRGRGFVYLVDYLIQVVLDNGYKELDTGPFMMENTVQMKLAWYLERKYGVTSKQMRYYTLLKRF